MESGCPSALYYKVPDDDISENQLAGRDGQPAATDFLGTLEMLSTKRDILEAPEEEEESEGPPREQDLKEAYIQLVRGVQEWQDGCVYQGDFGLDMKLGYGEFSWPTGELYHGQFYRDHRHGLGTYQWPDGSSFTGMFYLSYREGYGTMYLKTRLFQGLYKADQRFGPGVETYPDGRQDVGLWVREHLIKLCTEVPRSFSIHNYPEYSGFLTHSPARLSLSDEEKVDWDQPEGQDPFFYDYKRFLLNDDLTLPPEMHIYSTDNSHLPMTCSFRKELDAQIFLNDIPPFAEDEEPWFIKNETPLMVKIQKQTYKYRNKKAHTSWNMGAILEGDRSGFAHHGPKEQLSKEMILRAEEGDYDWIYRILRDDLASADVADAKGYTVLAAATVHCHTDIVNLLLDSGADVNRYTDEGLTPLSMCFLLYYPSTCFKPNIAERMVPKSQVSPVALQLPARCPVYYPPVRLSTQQCTSPRLAQEAPNMPVNPNLTFSFPEMAMESIYFEDLVPTPGSQEQKSIVWGSEEDHLSPGARLSQESPDLGSSPQKQDLSPWDSSSDLEKGPDGTEGSLGRCTLGSQETNFESAVCVRNFSFGLSQDLLERSAQAHSMLKAPSFSATGFDKGTMRKMALAVVERRTRWLTIELLLHRGADPNLCRVPMQALFFAVKAGDVAGVRLLLEHGARTDIQLPAELGALTPLHIAAALPGEEGVRITELLLHTVTDVDARVADEDDVYKPSKLDLLPSSLKLNNEAGPAGIYHSRPTCVPDEGGRTALHVACEREDSYKCARDIVRLLLSHRANPNVLWSGHSPLSLSIASGNDLIVKELLSHGADPNLLLTRGLGNALCVACDLTYEHQRSMDSRLALIDRLIGYGADILNPVTLTQGDKVAVGTAVDYGYFRFHQDRKIARSPFYALMPVDREVLLARKQILEYMGFQLRRAVFAKESQWDPKVLYLSKRAELTPYRRLKQKSTSLSKELHLEEQEPIPFFKFCYWCGRSVGVRLVPCTRCYGILTCSKYCKTRAWGDFHKRDCGSLLAIARKTHPAGRTPNFQKTSKHLGKEASQKPSQKPEALKPPRRLKGFYSMYSHE
ncbi:ankyrin repeat and MYND domain-containing protein 1 isoform X1 [Neofelis nebulosa]|uniref:ankyrin repeat and MYND domain-containing protein 1 isoform X1 n=2 Tax=Neofelis nebulosa TaxID=61452 RepID=UPI00272967F3|nr:ankyrin repeat and MYND domain-containing protein 1 isoform X1 [Neofelis nebulosa]XP_058555013.1 ankyrin repeat and MYND domain-containing protein 1 isoform X1 [Neofelis nebulosa]XP_058555016.1 ankyrin repeat and MYND domain-containing protein 1 isoform X1 [Neofelis nebulosa]XP_058555034.1 ankyrin repeat and MYND domain-containing protein 1 isoform X1 [Neofelis nebulosa]